MWVYGEQAIKHLLDKIKTAAVGVDAPQRHDAQGFRALHP